jgi:hypothetical protein
MGDAKTTRRTVCAVVIRPFALKTPVAEINECNRGFSPIIAPGCTFGLGFSTLIRTVFRRAFDLRIIVLKELFYHRHRPSKIA